MDGHGVLTLHTCVRQRCILGHRDIQTVGWTERQAAPQHQHTSSITSFIHMLRGTLVECAMHRAIHPTHAGRNAFDGYTPSNPEGKRLDFGGPDFLQLEEGGLAAVGHAAFVLVAGGLGERLGYKGKLCAGNNRPALYCLLCCCPWRLWRIVGLRADCPLYEPAAPCLHAGIKVALPAESASGRCFLQLYIEMILALQVCPVLFESPALACLLQPLPSCALSVGSSACKASVTTDNVSWRSAGCVWCVSTRCAAAPGHHDK